MRLGFSSRACTASTPWAASRSMPRWPCTVSLRPVKSQLRPVSLNPLSITRAGYSTHRPRNRATAHLALTTRRQPAAGPHPRTGLPGPGPRASPRASHSTRPGPLSTSRHQPALAPPGPAPLAGTVSAPGPRAGGLAAGPAAPSRSTAGPPRRAGDAGAGEGARGSGGRSERGGAGLAGGAGPAGRGDRHAAAPGGLGRRRGRADHGDHDSASRTSLPKLGLTAAWAGKRARQRSRARACD